MKKYLYSEVFHSIQGEGHYTGRPTVWLRFFLCNLQCNGFGQIDPTDESTYELPYQDFDVNEKDETGEYVYKKMTDLPVWHKGCDSSYSWSKKFKRLQYQGTAEEIAEKMLHAMWSDMEDNSQVQLEKAFKNHYCFTGGEPLMKHAQECSAEILKYYVNKYGMSPPSVTYETNGTQSITKQFYDDWRWLQDRGTELFFSLSPKLWSVAGELTEKAILPHVVTDYYELSNKGQLKFVVNGTDECWKELEETIDRFRQAGVYYPIWLMNAGATLEGQKGEISGHVTEAEICNEALARGYNCSTRAHVHIYGNTIGT